jgi:hypothetical protein
VYVCVLFILTVGITPCNIASNWTHFILDRYKIIMKVSSHNCLVQATSSSPFFLKKKKKTLLNQRTYSCFLLQVENSCRVRPVSSLKGKLPIKQGPLLVILDKLRLCLRERKLITIGHLLLTFHSSVAAIFRSVVLKNELESSTWTTIIIIIYSK